MIPNEQLGNEIGKNRGISMVLHDDDEDEVTTRVTLQRVGSKIALNKKKKKSAHIQSSVPAYLTNEGLFTCIHESNIFQECAMTDLSTWRLLGSICASAK